MDVLLLLWFAVTWHGLFWVLDLFEFLNVDLGGFLAGIARFDVVLLVILFWVEVVLVRCGGWLGSRFVG